MILHSARSMDTQFIAKAIREHKLDPVPVTGFHSKPTYWQENARWRRVAEQYKWGYVLFIDDREKKLFATILVKGEFDLAKGTVAERGGHKRPIGVSWYNVLCDGLKDYKPDGSEIPLPPCFGHHEYDHICDGGTNPETKQPEPACAWRDQCMALQRHAAETDKKQTEILKGKSPEQIIQLSTKLLERYKPVLPTPTPGDSAAPKPAKPRKPKAKADDTGLKAFVLDTCREVARRCCVGYADHQQLAVANELFIIDRSASTDYISLYQAVPKARPRAICSFRLRKRIQGTHVQLPLDKGDQLLSGFVPEDVVAWSDGAFKCMVKDVIPGQKRAEYITDILTRIVKNRNT